MSDRDLELALPARAVVDESRAVLAEKARSFRWASVFLPAGRRDDAAITYAVCRLVDDLADEADDPQTADVDLEAVVRELMGQDAPRPLIAAYRELLERRGGRVDPVLELIRGVRGDLDPPRFENDRTLIRYCYRVAGTVGLMMCSVLGVDDERAIAHAVDLGVAMQLTNICRDVKEDAQLGRVYLPRARLLEVGVDPEDLLRGDADRAAVSRVVSDLLELAEAYYSSADEGMRYIPWRSRLAILVASRVYRAIGRKLLRTGGDALAGRTIVAWPEKLSWVSVALYRFGLLAVRAPVHHDARLHAHLGGLPGCAT